MAEVKAGGAPTPATSALKSLLAVPGLHVAYTELVVASVGPTIKAASRGCVGAVADWPC
jgi:hypothetical protein